MDEDKLVQSILETIDNLLALAGFKILDGDESSVIVRHSDSDADFEIKVERLY